MKRTRRKKTGGNPPVNIEHTFNCFNEVIDTVFELIDKPEVFNRHKEYIDDLNGVTSRKDFYTAKNINFARENYLKGINIKHTDFVNTHKKNYEYFSRDVAGIPYDIPGYIAGVPDCMVNYSDNEDTQKYLTIFYNPAIAYYLKDSDLNIMSMKFLQYINDLENTGTRVRLYIDFYGGDSESNTYRSIIKIKDYSDPLNPSAHGYVFGTIDAARYFIYSLARFNSIEGSIFNIVIPHKESDFCKQINDYKIIVTASNLLITDNIPNYLNNLISSN